MTPPAVAGVERSFATSGRQNAFHFNSWLEARKEADRRKADPAWAGFVIRVERSSYGDGYTVRAVPIDKILQDGGLGARVDYKDL